MRRLKRAGPALAALLLVSLLPPCSCRRAEPEPEGDPVAGVDPLRVDFPVFPADNPWNADISSLPVHPDSAAFIAAIGRDGALHPDFGTVWEGAPNGIPYRVVGGDQPAVPVTYTAYGEESDPGPFPIPGDAPVEGGDDSDGDRHVIVIDRDHRVLYELYRAFKAADGWEAESGARWSLASNAVRPKYWTSADAAGLPIFPGLVRYLEAQAGEIRHALRCTVRRTQRGFIFPARHFASSSSDPALPPMGLRLRLKADVDVSGFSALNQRILRALKRYGMLVADNGGDWYLSGAPDGRWDDDDLHELQRIRGRDFEAVYTGPIER